MKKRTVKTNVALGNSTWRWKIFEQCLRYWILSTAFTEESCLLRARLLSSMLDLAKGNEVRLSILYKLLLLLKLQPVANFEKNFSLIFLVPRCYEDMAGSIGGGLGHGSRIHFLLCKGPGKLCLLHPHSVFHKPGIRKVKSGRLGPLQGRIIHGDPHAWYDNDSSELMIFYASLLYMTWNHNDAIRCLVLEPSPRHTVIIIYLVFVNFVPVQTDL
ncbi:hypothetical protein POTOM_034434 [Populus tomentosa]|uniref:Uncharacterized protein n=1 Tax=Populus tomentosa TaxID=118781 RepID=A0A8X8CPB4_POPTO|nr:hypothetical protein POTOM_034434 [Populus tomentosa]